MGLERHYKVCNFRLKAETRWSLKQTCQPPHTQVCSPTVALLHKKGPRHRRKICANSLWLYSYFTQTSPSKKKNINYIFIYLRVFRCLSSGSIYDTSCRVFHIKQTLNHIPAPWLVIGFIVFLFCLTRRCRSNYSSDFLQAVSVLLFKSG